MAATAEPTRRIPDTDDVEKAVARSRAIADVLHQAGQAKSLQMRPASLAELADELREHLDTIAGAESIPESGGPQS